MHFETLWTQVEETTEGMDGDEAVRQLYIGVDELSHLTPEKVGDALLYLAVIAKKLNINVFKELQDAEARWLIAADIDADE